jgi:ribosome-binding factor A
VARRIKRLNTLIRHEISELLQRQVKDPRLGTFVAVTEVSTSADLSRARVFVSCLCSEAEKEETLSALASASGFLRRELAGRLRLRRIPELNFEWDNSIERGAHIQELIDRLAVD